MARVRHLHTKVVGTTFPNPDGTDRQTLIRQCQLFEQLDLIHDEENPADPNAIMVCRQDGSQIGFLTRDLASEVLRRSANGVRYLTYVKNITGGYEGRDNLGVNLLIIVVPPEATKGAIRDYIDSLDVDDASSTVGHGPHQPQPRYKETTTSPGHFAFFIVAVIIALSFGLYRSSEPEPSQEPGITTPATLSEPSPKTNTVPRATSKPRTSTGKETNPETPERQELPAYMGLFMGMSLERVEDRIGFEGHRRMKAGTLEAWDWVSREGWHLRAKFDDGILRDWELLSE